LWSTKTSFAEEARMRDAVCPPQRMRYSFESRCRIVQLIIAGASPQAAAAACGASRATGYRLWRRYREGGWAALADRPSTPLRQPRRLPEEVEQEILAWREHLRAGPAVIAAILERPISTVGKVLRRAGCSRLPRAQRDPKVRYERDRAGELLHVDTKKLGRFHQVGNGSSRMAFSAVATPAGSTCTSRSTTTAASPTPNCSPAIAKKTCAAFLRRAVGWYAEHGIRIERVISDNAKAYHSGLWQERCAELGIGRRYTRPYSPWTNGKAEALIKTLLREWAYRFGYPSSAHRARALPGFTRWYNRRRPHGSLKGRPPISRVSHVCGEYI
jgi:transposase